MHTIGRRNHDQLAGRRSRVRQAGVRARDHWQRHLPEDGLSMVTYSFDRWPKRLPSARLSPNVLEMTGYSPAVLGTELDFDEIVFEPDRVAARRLHSAGGQREYRIVRADGTLLTVIDSCEVLGPSGRAIRGILIERPVALADTRDALTMLLNRGAFLESLESQIGAACRLDEDLSVILMDLDSFRDVNDALGHSFGDQLLIAVARRFERSFRSNDTVARLGGDEFAAILRGVSCQDASRIAREIADVVEAPFLLDGRQITIAASIGVTSLAERPALTGADLMRLAEVAMYSAKRKHSRVAAYGSELQVAPSSGADFSRLGDLHSAIERHEFVMFFQPWLRVTEGRVDACEALLRWNHPFRGTLAPAEFLPLAERSGLIRQLDLIALDLACRQAIAWRDGGIHIRVAVNASRESLLDEDFGDHVSSSLSRYGLAGDDVEIEITEQGILGDPGQAARFAEKLERIGVRIALDDFGTGYSSFAQLRELKVSALKIDRSFVSGVLVNDKDAAIAETIISLGHRLGKEVVAEGVENAETLNRLRVLGADYIQGYEVARPMPGEELAPWLAQYRPPSVDQPHEPKLLAGKRKGLAA
jgi:diguanylate cyclase (GGDEF)-like protein